MATVLIFGASGMAGGGVLAACLASADVTEVRVIARRPFPFPDRKMKVILHQDYGNFAGLEDAFRDVDLCLFCLGVSVTQASDEAEYRRITCDFALTAARVLKQQSPNAAFHYISGQGASFKSPMMWARVKAEAEQDLMGEFGAVCFRPGAIGGKPADRTPFFIRTVNPLLRILSPIRWLYVHNEDIGRAMLRAYRKGLRSMILENNAIRDLADPKPAAA